MDAAATATPASRTGQNSRASNGPATMASAVPSLGRDHHRQNERKSYAIFRVCVLSLTKLNRAAAG